jgi:hypothetical protein
VDVDENLFPVPSRFAHFEELEALSAVLGERGRMLQVVPEFYSTDITLARVDQLAALSLRHGIPTTFSPLFDSAATPTNVVRVLDRVSEQFAPLGHVGHGEAHIHLSVFRRLGVSEYAIDAGRRRSRGGDPGVRLQPPAFLAPR